MDEESPSGFVETQRGIIRRSSYSQKQSSGSSGPDDNTLHFTATVSGHHSNKQQEEQPSPPPNSEIIGSYLARQEFGSNEGGGQPIGDSGYISHSSAGNYPKMPLPVIYTSVLCSTRLIPHDLKKCEFLQTQPPMESFTMSVDRGYLGRAPGDRDPPTLHRSMDDLTFQKTKGLELVRLLRVIYLLYLPTFFKN